MQDNVVYYMIVDKKEIEEMSETKQARNVLKIMLEYFNLDLPIIYISKNGKPYFKESYIYFNYSHSKNYIACAIAMHEVGIDIEEADRKISEDVARKYLDSEKKIDVWVRKEAYSKLKGLGLLLNFKNIKLDEIKENNILINNNKYVCSIYCDCKSVSFVKIHNFT